VSGQPGPGRRESEEPPPNPVANPFFLPALLAGFALWFAYDGFLNDDFAARHRAAGDAWVVGFNRWGAAALGALAALTGGRALRARGRAQKSGSSSGA
jgi:hypothetical protein